MVKYPGPSHRRKLSPSQACGVSGEPGRAMTAEELSQSQDHSNQVGREQGNTSSLFPPSHWLPQSEARGQESSDDVVPRNQPPGTQSRAQERVESGSGGPKETTQHTSGEVGAGPGHPARI